MKKFRSLRGKIILEKVEHKGQKNREMQFKMKVEVRKVKQRAYVDLYYRLDTKEGEVNLFSSVDRDEKIMM